MKKILTKGLIVKVKTHRNITNMLIYLTIVATYIGICDDLCDYGAKTGTMATVSGLTIG